jgi:Uma2 family endonuclease
MNESVDEGIRYTAERYFQLVEEGVLHADDHVELLEGIIVAEPPQNPPHATGTTRAYEALHEAVGRRAVIRVQLPLILGTYSVPEPDVAIVPGRISDYERAHPTTALLVVETADTSLPKDRLSKSRIYAAAGIPEYWIINLRDHRVEVFRRPDERVRQYTERTIAGRGERLSLAALPDASVSVDELMPPLGGEQPVVRNQ